MLRRWAFRLAFPALGLLMVLMFFGINVEAPPAAEETESAATKSFESVIPTPSKEEGPDIVFKWRDAKGNWHYADKPPSKGRWNALALDPTAVQISPPHQVGEDQNWQAPYSTPFSLSADGIRQYDNSATP
jgi:hypothetical protein